MCTLPTCALCEKKFTPFRGDVLDVEVNLGICDPCGQVLNELKDDLSTLWVFDEPTATEIISNEERYSESSYMDEELEDGAVVYAIQSKVRLASRVGTERRKAHKKASLRKERKLHQAIEARQRKADPAAYACAKAETAKKELRLSKSFRHRDDYAARHEMENWNRETVTVMPVPEEFSITDDRDTYTTIFLELEALKKKGVVSPYATMDDLLEFFSLAGMTSVEELGDITPALLPWDEDETEDENDDEWTVTAHRRYPDGFGSPLVILD